MEWPYWPFGLMPMSKAFPSDLRAWSRTAGYVPGVRACLALLLVLAPACVPPEVPDDPVDDDDTTEEIEGPRGWEGVFAIISIRCGCHDPFEQAGGMFDLTEEDDAYDTLVGTPSIDVPSLNRIEPGDPDASYAFLKVTNRQSEVGGAGNRMPPTGFALPEDDIDLIREWIEDGARRE